MSDHAEENILPAMLRVREAEVDALMHKAGRADKADDALKFSQGALNIAHAIRVLKDIVDVTSTG